MSVNNSHRKKTNRTDNSINNLKTEHNKNANKQRKPFNNNIKICVSSLDSL